MFRLSKILILTLFFLATDASAFPPNTRMAFQLEIFHNPALELKDFRYMAAAILKMNDGLSIAEAINKSSTLSEREAKSRLTEDFAIEYYEIPAEILKQTGVLNADHLQGLGADKLSFTRNGQTWIRWFVHPLHNSDFMDKQFATYKQQGRFRALLTSSRSLLVQDTTDNFTWSQKTSLNRSQGPFSSKSFSTRNAQFQFYLSSILSTDPYLNDKLLFETSVVTLVAGNSNSDFDEGQLSRSLSPLNLSGKFLALASFFDKKIATRIAQANGYNKDWQSFLAEKVIPDLGRTCAHLYETYGLVHNSLHSQNIIIQLNDQGKYLGVRLRDLDFDINYEKLRAASAQNDRAMKILDRLAINSFRANDLTFDFSVMNGLKNFRFNDQGARELYRQLGVSFVATFLKQLATTRNPSLSEDSISDRAQRYITVQAHSDEYTQRYSINFTEADIETLLDPKNDSPTHFVSKTRLKPGAAQKLILAALTSSEVSTYSFNEADLRDAWTAMVSEFMRSGQSSPLGVIIAANRPNDIERMLRIFNENPGWETTALMAHLISSNRDFCRNNLSVYFRAHFNEKLMVLYLSVAPSDQLMGLWNFLKVTRMLEYSQAVMTRFLVRLPEAAFLKVEREIQLKNEKSTQPKLGSSQGELNAALRALASAKALRSSLRKCSTSLN